MNPERTEHKPVSLDEQFDHPDVLEIGDQSVEVVDIKPEIKKSEIPVVISPGLPQSRHSFRGNIIGLAERGRRTISIDAPYGVEKTDIVDVTGVGTDFAHPEIRKIAALFETLDQKGIGQIDAVGHSEGAMYLVMAAALDPERFRNLVLVNPGGMIGEDSTHRLLSRFAEHMFDKRKKTVGDEDKTERVLAANKVGRVNMRKDLSKTFEHTRAIAVSRVEHLLQGIRENGVGVVIVHSVDDKIFTMDRVQKMIKKEMIDGFYSTKGTHTDFFTDPEQYTKLVDQALDALEAKK